MKKSCSLTLLNDVNGEQKRTGTVETGEIQAARTGFEPTKVVVQFRRVAKIQWFFSPRNHQISRSSRTCPAGLGSVSCVHQKSAASQRIFTMAAPSLQLICLDHHYWRAECARVALFMANIPFEDARMDYHGIWPVVSSLSFPLLSPEMPSTKPALLGSIIATAISTLFSSQS